MRRYLVVANQTLGGDELAKSVRDRMAAGPCEFWVLVPATPAKDLVSPSMPPMGGVPVSVPASAEQGRALAQARLDAALDRLRATVAVADGEVGDLDPMRAIEQSLTRRHFDEILVSTLPARWSRWLRQDLPSRVERKFNLPVSYVSATGG